MKITKDKLAEMILKSLNEQVEEGKFGSALAGLGLAATLATSMPSCGYINRNEPDMHWTHEGPYSEQEKQEKTWNTHQERGDWENVEPGVGFIYDCYTRCANSGGGWTIHVIFADKSTGKFILPQECREYLDGRYMPNCNCFENENTTDRVNTNGLQRLDGSENITVFENKIKHNMKQTIKLKESQLRNMIREAINEIGDTEKGQEALGALHAKKVYDKYRDDYKKTGELCGHVRTDDEARVLNYAVDKQSKSKDPVGMKSAYDNGYVKQRDKENAKGINESKLDSIIKESINKVLNESRYADAIADRLFAQLENPNTPIYKKNQIKQELISMGYLQMPNKQSQQTTQQRGGDIYSQTIQALNSNNYAFFNNGNGRQLQGVLSGLYNQGKITYNEYNKGMQWIGQGFQYSNASGKYNW